MTRRAEVSLTSNCEVDSTLVSDTDSGGRNANLRTREKRTIIVTNSLNVEFIFKE